MAYGARYSLYPTYVPDYFVYNMCQWQRAGAKGPRIGVGGAMVFQPPQDILQPGSYVTTAT